MKSAAPQRSGPQSGCAPESTSTKEFSLAGSELGFVDRHRVPPFCLKCSLKIWPVSYPGIGQCGYDPPGDPLAVNRRSHQRVLQDILAFPKAR